MDDMRLAIHRMSAAPTLSGGVFRGKHGGVAERSKAVVLKTTVAVMSPGVRIPPPPPSSMLEVGYNLWGGRIARSSAPAC